MRDGTLTCVGCGDTYLLQDRAGFPGKVITCADCAEESVERYTGNNIYGHKTGAALQINRCRTLTDYINNSTKLRNKGSNLGNNLKVSGPAKATDLCVTTADADVNAKGKSI